MNDNFWTSDRIVSASAIFISLATLFVFVYQTNLIRTQQHMSVYPHLSLGNFYSGSLEYQFVLANEGIGPAFIQSIAITDTLGNAYESISDYVYENIIEDDSIFIYSSDIYEGRLIPAGEEIPLFGLIDEEQLAEYGLPSNTLEGEAKLREILNSEALKLKLTYRSIYNDQWYITEETTLPIEL